MNVTDEEMAKALDKTISQIEELKTINQTMYQFLKTGVLCKKLDLSEKDLEKIYDKKVVS